MTIRHSLVGGCDRLDDTSPLMAQAVLRAWSDHSQWHWHMKGVVWEERVFWWCDFSRLAGHPKCAFRNCVFIGSRFSNEEAIRAVVNQCDKDCQFIGLSVMEDRHTTRATSGRQRPVFERPQQRNAVRNNGTVVPMLQSIGREGSSSSLSDRLSDYCFPRETWTSSLEPFTTADERHLTELMSNRMMVGEVLPSSTGLKMTCPASGVALGKLLNERSLRSEFSETLTADDEQRDS